MIDRKSAPTHAEISSLTLPVPHYVILSNGAPLIILNGVSQAVLKIDVVFSASKWTEPISGLAHFTSAMLEKGTAKMNSFQIAEFFERYGATVEISSGFDFTTVSLYTPSQNLENVFSLFVDLFTAPSFPSDELSIVKNLFAQNLKINNEKTSYLASKIFRQKLFPTAHPYGSSVEQSDVERISINDLNLFFKSHFKPQYFFVTGNISEATQAFLSKHIGSISYTPLDIKNNVYENLNGDSDKFHLEKSDSIQTSIRLGKRTINKTNNDYPALVLLNHILGGYFGSRLMKNIREEKGLTYGIYSSITTLKNDSYLVIGADVNKSNKDLAISEIKSEVNKLKFNIIDHNEFQIAKSHLLGSLQLELASPFSVIEKIKGIHLYNLNSNFYSDLFEKIYSLQATDLTKVASKHLDENFIEISVG